jgi:SNF2 family DNA or RNA helicase
MEQQLREAVRRVQKNLRGRLIVPYQADGVFWMLRRERDPRYPGGLLCDDMGLGKTIQTIATMIGNPQSSTLVVVPKAVVDQWAEAFRRFMDVEATVITSSTVEKLADIKKEDLEGRPIVITTYPTIVANHEPFHAAVFSRIVCDEVHCIRNSKSLINNLVTKINARIRWGLTGTPIVKNLRDFSNLMVFLGRVPLDRQQLAGLKNVYVLRRTKEDVASVAERLRLPPLDMRLISVPFRHDEERRLYDDVCEEGRMRLATESNNNKKNTNMNVFEAVLRLRQVVTNPQTFVEGIKKKSAGEHDPDFDYPTTWDYGCTKLEVLVELIAEQPRNEKTLIFCHWMTEMNCVQAALRDRLGIDSLRLDGTMSTDKRTQVVDEFEHSRTSNFLVIQIDCGGVGLNLQAATRVYINSIHWNAANELQAIGRTHRTGQTRTVVVTRLVIRDTIDEYIIKKQAGKLEIAAETLEDSRLLKRLDDARGFTQIITKKDLMRIFQR